MKTLLKLFSLTLMLATFSGVQAAEVDVESCEQLGESTTRTNGTNQDGTSVQSDDSAEGVRS